MNSALMKRYFKNKDTYDDACEEYVELDEDWLLRMDVDNMELYQTLFQIKSKAANAKLYTFPVGTILVLCANERKRMNKSNSIYVMS